jgi:predicted ArsR family transcriptional regulator
MSEKTVDFFKFSGYTPIMEGMEGLTISEMAKILEISPDTVLKRLQRAGIKPISREVVYDKAALKAIRHARGRGRPKKGE